MDGNKDIVFTSVSTRFEAASWNGEMSLDTMSSKRDFVGSMARNFLNAYESYDILVSSMALLSR